MLAYAFAPGASARAGLGYCFILARTKATLAVVSYKAVQGNSINLELSTSDLEYSVICSDGKDFHLCEIGVV